MAQEAPGQTLQATGLVHEAYLRLVDVEKTQHWNSRGHFFAAAAEAMRRILVEQARRKRRKKHGGDLSRVVLEEVVGLAEPVEDLLALDEVLGRLAVLDPAAAKLVTLVIKAGTPKSKAAGGVLTAKQAPHRRNGSGTANILSNDKSLPAILQGKAKPTNAAEQIDLQARQAGPAGFFRDRAGLLIVGQVICGYTRCL